MAGVLIVGCLLRFFPGSPATTLHIKLQAMTNQQVCRHVQPSSDHVTMFENGGHWFGQKWLVNCATNLSGEEKRYEVGHL